MAEADHTLQHAQLHLCRLVDVSCRDYVAENTKDLVPKRSAAAQSTDFLSKEDYGLVPRYLLRFKLDRATSAATKQVIKLCTAALLRWWPTKCPLDVPLLHRQQLMRSRLQRCLTKSAQHCFRSSLMHAPLPTSSCSRSHSLSRHQVRHADADAGHPFTAALRC